MIMNVRVLMSVTPVTLLPTARQCGPVVVTVIFVMFESRVLPSHCGKTQLPERATESGALGKTEYGEMAEWSMAVVLKTSTLCYSKTVMLAIAYR